MLLWLVCCLSDPSFLATDRTFVSACLKGANPPVMVPSLPPWASAAKHRQIWLHTWAVCRQTVCLHNLLLLFTSAQVHLLFVNKVIRAWGKCSALARPFWFAVDVWLFDVLSFGCAAFIFTQQTLEQRKPEKHAGGHFIALPLQDPQCVFSLLLTWPE